MALSNQQLANRILVGMLCGLGLGMVALLLGHANPGLLDACRTFAAAVLDPFGLIFLRLLFFVVIPLVFASLAQGVAQLGRLDKLGPLAVRTAAFFGLNMAIGVALGLLMMNAIQPGNALDTAQKEKLLAQFGGTARSHLETHETQQGLNFRKVVEMFMPANLARAVVGENTSRIGDVLPLILFAILVGAAATQLGDAERQRVQSAFDIIVELMTRIVRYALLLAPYAVPAMVFSVIVKAGWDIIESLGKFVFWTLVIIAIHLFGTMTLLLKTLTRRSPMAFFRALRPVLVTAFSTSSSNATLPTSLQVSREVLGVSPSTAGFVLPLGATMNMSGTALYEGCVVLYVAQVYGVQLGLMQQLTLLVLAVLSAVAVAGVPGGSLPLIAGLLVTFGVPPEGLSIVIGVDRILDMARTTVNVGADIVTACIVDEQLNPASPAPSTSQPPSSA